MTNRTESSNSTNTVGELMSIQQVQAELHCGRTTVYNLIHEGKLQSVKVGKYRRITRLSYKEYLEELYKQIGPRT